MINENLIYKEFVKVAKESDKQFYDKIINDLNISNINNFISVLLELHNEYYSYDFYNNLDFDELLLPNLTLPELYDLVYNYELYEVIESDYFYYDGTNLIKYNIDKDENEIIDYISYETIIDELIKNEQLYVYFIDYANCID